MTWTGWFNDSNLSFHGPVGWESKRKVFASLVSSDASCPGL